MRWSLDELYTSFESEEYSLDIKKLDKQIEEMIKWAENSFKAIEGPINII